MKDIQQFFSILSQQRKNPQTELYYTNPYTLLVAVVLSAQATDKGVNKATPSLFQRADTPQKMLNLGIDSLRELIGSIGLYPTKAKHIMALSKILMEEYEGKVPEDRDALLQLPGVGRKTANVVLNVAFDWPTIPVDTHVFRVARRTGLSSGTTPQAVEEELLQKTPPAFLKSAHHLLILHGRYTCRARQPLCTQCPVRHLCAAYPET